MSADAKSATSCPSFIPEHLFSLSVPLGHAPCLERVLYSQHVHDRRPRHPHTHKMGGCGLFQDGFWSLVSFYFPRFLSLSLFGAGVCSFFVTSHLLSFFRMVKTIASFETETKIRLVSIGSEL